MRRDDLRCKACHVLAGGGLGTGEFTRNNFISLESFVFLSTVHGVPRPKEHKDVMVVSPNSHDNHIALPLNSVFECASIKKSTRAAKRAARQHHLHRDDTVHVVLSVYETKLSTTALCTSYRKVQRL